MDFAKVLTYFQVGLMVGCLSWAAFLMLREVYRSRFAKAKDVEIMFIDEN